jgi:hypothetical protein
MQWEVGAEPVITVPGRREVIASHPRIIIDGANNPKARRRLPIGYGAMTISFNATNSSSSSAFSKTKLARDDGDSDAVARTVICCQSDSPALWTPRN